MFKPSNLAFRVMPPAYFFIKSTASDKFIFFYEQISYFVKNLIGLFLISLALTLLLDAVAMLVCPVLFLIFTVLVLSKLPSSEGRKELNEPDITIPVVEISIKGDYSPIVWLILTAVVALPLLFTFSLLFQWYLAAQIILGILASLLVLFVTVLIFSSFFGAMFEQESDLRPESKNKEFDQEPEAEKENNLNKSSQKNSILDRIKILFKKKKKTIIYCKIKKSAKKIIYMKVKLIFKR